MIDALATIIGEGSALRHEKRVANVLER